MQNCVYVSFFSVNLCQLEVKIFNSVEKSKAADIWINYWWKTSKNGSMFFGIKMSHRFQVSCNGWTPQRGTPQNFLK